MTPPAAPPWQPYPTRALAGGDACSVGAPITLGPFVQQHTASVGFGPRGGLAAWRRTPAELVFQKLAHDGSLVGTPAVLASTDAEIEPRHVVAIDRGFVVLFVRWDWQRHDARWFGTFVDAKTLHSGSASPKPSTVKPLVDLDLAHTDVLALQAIDERRVALIVYAAAIAPQGKQIVPRWQTLDVAADGVLTSTPVAVKLATDEGWQPAKFGGVIGWRNTLRGGKPIADAAREGLFDGKRVPAAGALPLVPPDIVVADVINAAKPIPRRGGIQYEARAQPTFVRTLAGTELTSASLDDAGVIGFMMSGELVWSGERFLYVYKDSGSARMLPIDCR